MPKRVQRQRKAGEPGMPPGAIYVGRPTVWGNPWKVTTHGGLDIEGPGMFFCTADEHDAAHQFAVSLYYDWLTRGACSVALMCRRRDETNEDRRNLDHRRRRILGDLPTLRDRDLACWCPPYYACHADVLLELANQEVRA